MRVRLSQQRLLAFLAQSRLSQNHWALKLGLSRGHWSEIVNGRHPFPSPKTRERMVEVLGIPFEELFEVETGIPSWADTDFRRAIADRYLIDSEVGQGGMGAVYLARDTRHGRVVAVKVIAPEAVSGIGINQFLREIATVAQLQHPHILPLFDSGEAAGHPFFVMPYIRGGSLRARLKSAIRLPSDEVAALTAGMASALQHAHEQRILHCDVKPENILLDGTHAYVMDFGVARKLHAEVLPWIQRKDLDLSAGTPAYVSPEQASGEKDLDTRSDVYSLACVVYEMLSGRPPFEGTTTQAVVSRRFIEPAPPLREFAPEVPPLLEQAVEQGMELEPKRRTASPAEFSAAVIAAAKPASGGLARLSIALTRGLSRLRRSRPGLTTRLGSLGMEPLIQDLRHAFRALRLSPAFAAVVVATLALGIGANTAIFSVVRGVLLKPLPHRDGDRLVYLRQSSDQSTNLNFSVPEVRDFRTGAPSLAQIAEYSPTSVILRSDQQAMRLRVGLVTGNYFEVMGLRPILGRLTRPSDDGPGVPPVMVLTHEFWMRRFGGDSSIVGKQVTSDGISTEVIGIVQAAPFFPDRMDVLMNMVISPHHLGASMLEDRRHRMTEMVARLTPTATLDQAKSEVAAVYTRLRDQYPDSYGAAYHYHAEMIPFKKALGQSAQLTLWLLMGSAAFVMIIAAANVANLTLMRRVRREQEMLVRAALGAGVARLRRLLLAENLVLCVFGAAFGTIIAIAGVPLLVSLAKTVNSARANEIQLDTPVLLFTLTLSVATALFLSFVASVPSEKDLATVSSGGRRSGGTLKKQRLQRALVVVQVAVSVVLLAGAGLLTRTMLRLADVQTGLQTEEVLSMDVTILTRAERSNPEVVGATRALFAQIREEIAGLPGVEAVAVGAPPLQIGFRRMDVKVEGRPLGTGEAAPNTGVRLASPDYFASTGIPLLRGRTFMSTDQGASGSVGIVNQEFVDRIFPREDPIGRRVAETNRIQQYDTMPDDWVTIVGIVGNTKDELDAPIRPEMYRAQFTEQSTGGGLVIRAQRGAAALATPATRIVRRLAPTAAIENVKTVAQAKDEGVAPRRLNAALISMFGILAVVIAAVGIAGVLAFSVSARTNEIGVRMSLGADGAMVQRMILMEGGVLVVLGLVVGTVGALAVAGTLRGLLFGVAPHDPATFAGVAVLMAAIGVTACWIPAVRASRIDPAITMRAEQ